VQLGVLAIFMYVGGEVPSQHDHQFLGSERGGTGTVRRANTVAVLGRHVDRAVMGAVELSEMKKVNKQFALVPFPSGFLLFWILRSWNSDNQAFDFVGVNRENYLRCWGCAGCCFQFGKALAADAADLGTTIVICWQSPCLGGKWHGCIVARAVHLIGWRIFSLG